MVVTAEVRVTVTRRVEELVNRKVPALWRARARLYIPMVVDELLTIIEHLEGER